MTVLFQVEFKNSLLTRTMPDGTQDTSPVDQNEIRKLEGMSQDYSWNTSPALSFDPYSVPSTLTNFNLSV